MKAKANISPESVTTSLTRRATLIGIAAVAAPATAGAAYISHGFEGPDPVVRLCNAWREFEDHWQARLQRSREIHERVNAEMPLPDPSIVHGPEAEELKIKTPEYSTWGHLPHNAIEPSFIQDALFYVQPVEMRVSEDILPDGKIARTFIELDKPEFLSDAVQAKHDKLTRMMQLSKDYRAEHKRRLKAAGYDKGDDDVDDMADRQHVIERAIRITPAQTREGLLAKIKVHEARSMNDMDDGLVDSILRDTRRLLGAA